MSDKNNRVYLPEESPPLFVSLGLGIQHVFAMFGATVLAPLLMGFDPNTAIFFSGIATVLFFIIMGGKVPSYLGSSFAFITAVTVATGYNGIGINPNISMALGGIVVSGLLYFAIGFIVSFTGGEWLQRLFPPAVTGTIVAIIGLNLASVGVNQIGKDGIGVIIGLATLLAIVLLASHNRLSIIQRLPILFGGLIGYAVYYFLGNIVGIVSPIDFSNVNKSAWLGFPNFTAPSFDLQSIVLIAPVAFILVAENLGHIKGIGTMINRSFDKYMGRAFMADGLATMISGAGGGTGVTTYAENMGVMRITQNFSSITFFIAGILAICLGLSPKFGALIQTVPLPVLGGLSFVVFGLITATACSIWQKAHSESKVDFNDTGTLLSVGIALVMGAGDFTITIGNFSMGGIITATGTVLILYHLLAKKTAYS